MKNFKPNRNSLNPALQQPLLTESKYSLRFCVYSVFQNSFYRQLVESEAFRRLEQISFLGAINYLPKYKNISQKHKNRAQHSLNVAALALMISQQRSYSKSLTKHLVVAGLLHDIGHPPLSHSVEPYLKTEFGYGHHEMGEMLIDGEAMLGKSLARLLHENKISIPFIKKLIDGKAKDIDGGDLFSSKINLDTIEGIVRSSQYLSANTIVISPTKVALASLTNQLENKTAVLDSFWTLKNDVYNNLITSGNGLLADLHSQRLFLSKELELSQESLFQSEKSWYQKYAGVFNAIRNVENEDEKFEGLDSSFYFTKRKYYIEKNETDFNKRYLYTKKKAEYQIVKEL